MLTLIGTWAQANLRLKLKYQAGASQRSARVHGVLSIPCVQGVKRQPFTGLLNSFYLDVKNPGGWWGSKQDAFFSSNSWREFDADEVFLKIKFFLFYLITTIALRSHTWARVIDLSCSASRDFFKLSINSCVPRCPSPGCQHNWQTGSHKIWAGKESLAQ